MAEGVLKFKINDTVVNVDPLSYNLIKDIGLIILNASSVVSAMEFLPNQDFLMIANKNILNLWSIDPVNFTHLEHCLKMHQSIQTNLQNIKSLCWRSVAVDLDKYLLTVLDEEGTLCSLIINTLDTNVQVIEFKREEGEEEGGKYIFSSIQWTEDGKYLYVGTTDGRVLSLQYQEQSNNESGAGLVCVGSRKLSNLAITSIACKSTFELGVGQHGSESIYFNFLNNIPPISIYRPLALVPHIRWSHVLSSWITIDSDGYGRLFSSDELCRSTPDNSNNESTSYNGVGVSNISVLDVASSPFHNVIASVSGTGILHLSWIDPPSSDLISEVEIFKLTSENVHTPSIQVDFRLITASGKVGFTFQSDQYQDSLSHLQWSKSAKCPGLLAFTSGSTPAVFLLATDRFILLP